MWDTADKLASELPHVVDLLNGRTSIGKMSWRDINSLVKDVIGEVDHISEDLEEKVFGRICKSLPKSGR